MFIYDIKKDAWSDGPSLNQERYAHSSLTIDVHLYVFGGRVTYKEYCSSIECLKVVGKN